MLPHHVRQNLALSLVLGVASYLSAAAIAALPVLLEDVQASQSDVAEFRILLQGPERQLRVRPTEFLRKDPFGPLARVFEETGSAQAVTADVPSAEDQLAEARKHRERLRIEVENAVEYWTGHVNRARAQALVLFSQNADRKGNAERRQHYARLLVWFDYNLSEGQREISECVLSAEMADSDAAVWAAGKVRQVQRRHQPAVADLAIRWPVAMEQCGEGQRWGFAAVPERPELGARFGPFRLVAEWLVRTESLSLVAVVGLFGFGLLGSAASTIVREKGAQRERGTALVSDLPSVVVRGMVAAMVVFLAVKGGLVIFATGSPEPNPYVLLLTCLIAAIFSEPVFEGAQMYLTGLLDRWSRAGREMADPPADTTTNKRGRDS